MMPKDILRYAAAIFLRLHAAAALLLYDISRFLPLCERSHALSRALLIFLCFSRCFDASHFHAAFIIC